MTEAVTYKFHIYFFGLICHMGDEGRKHYAAIVRDEEHDPVVRFDDGNPKGDGKDVPIDEGTESLKFEIHDDITESDARPTLNFNRFVPSLQRLMNGSPRINITKYAIPVYYPETMGTLPDLDVYWLYKDLAWYRRFGEELRLPDCVARLTGIVVEVPNNNYKLQVIQVKHNAPSTPLGDPVDPNSCIVIANLPKDPNMTEGHVMKYGKILIGNESIVTILRPGECKATLKQKVYCDWVRRWLEGPASADVECGNTGWP